MSAPTDRPENPWKKRRQGPQEFMPPSRALFVEAGGRVATATWARDTDGWKCIAADGHLKWMRGATNPLAVRNMLADEQYRWHWIEPNTVRVLAPPF